MGDALPGRGGHRRRLRRWGLPVAALVAVVVAAGWLLYRDAVAARGALEEARTAVAAVQTALGDADLAAAETHLARASDAVAGASSRTSGPLWAFAAHVPLAGRSVEVVDAVVAVGRAAVDTVGHVVAGSRSLLDDDGGLRLTRRESGALALDELQEAGRFLDTPPRDALAAARNRLAMSPATWIHGEVADGRRDTLRMATDALGTVDRARTALDAFPGFLGADGPRRYLLALQNPAELRGTGGVIGFFAVLTVDGGELGISEPERYVVLVDEERTPVEASDEFVRRYGHNNANSFFGNVNLDPHLPISAPVMLAIYEERRGERLDGVVALDPVATQMILGAIGPVDVPADVADPSGQIPDPVPADRIAEVTMVDAYDVFGGTEPDRQDFHSAFAEAAFSLLLTEWDPIEVANRAGQAAGRRHLQVFSTQEEEQAAFEALGIAGRMPSTEDRDLLAVTANNAGGNKMDVHVAHRIRGTIGLTLDGDAGGARRTADLEVELENPLGTTGHDLYIIGNVLLGEKEAFGRFDGPVGLNRTWFTVWTGGSSHLSAAVDEDGQEAVFDSDDIHGHLAVDHHVEVPAESTRAFSVELEGAVPLRREGGDLVYDLTLWRQAKAIPDHWDLAIAPPDGWEVAEVALAGGGDGQGMGVAGAGRPMTVEETVDGRVRVSGAVTEDVAISVRFTRSTWRRFVGLLSPSG